MNFIKHLWALSPTITFLLFIIIKNATFKWLFFRLIKTTAFCIRMQQLLMQILHVTNTRYKNKSIKHTQATNNKQV